MRYLIRGLKQSRRLCLLLTFLTMAIGVPLVTGGTAHAASLCSGSLIDSPSISSNGTVIGELDLYYDGSTGENCAVTQSYGPSRGVQKEMMVSLAICYRTGPSWNCDPGKNGGKVDSGFYSYYAGPVSLSARGQCIMASGGIKWNGVLESTGTNPGHCGS